MITPTDVHFPVALDVIGVSVGAIQGVLFAVTRTRVTVVGVAVFAFVTALGGACIRDVLINQGPTVALSDLCLLVTLIAGLAGALIARLETRLATPLIVLDALYLGIWTVAGADKAIHAGFGAPACVLLGVITGVGGGVIRDILTSRAPTLFESGPLYTLASVAGAAIYVGLHSALSARIELAIAVIAIIFVIRVLAVRYRWLLPAAADLHPITNAHRENRRRPDARPIDPRRTPAEHG